MFELDTRKQHCPIMIVWTDGITTDPIFASELLYQRPEWARDPVPLAIIKDTEHGDYCGDAVQRSNHRVLMENKAVAPYLLQIHGSHGYEALAYDASLGPVPPCEELAEILEGLQVYPIIDDDDEGALEIELEDEAWNDGGRKEFWKELTKLLDELDPDYEHDLDPPCGNPACPTRIVGGQHVDACPRPTPEDKIDSIWRAGVQAYNVNGGSGFVIETGCIVSFYVEEWIDAARSEPDKASMFAAKYFGPDEQVPTLGALAEQSRL